jgi:hypothetical protein
MGGSSFGKQFGKITTKIVDPFGIGKTKFGKTVMKVVDPLNIMDPLNVLPGKGEKWGTLDKNYGGPLRKMFGGGGGGSVGYHQPYDFKAMQGMMQSDTSNQMMGDLITQQAMANQAASTQTAANLQAANAQQQQNINSAMQNSRQNMNNFLLRTPVPSTFSAITPATQNKTTNNAFKTPNVAGLTFGS